MVVEKKDWLMLLAEKAGVRASIEYHCKFSLGDVWDLECLLGVKRRTVDRIKFCGRVRERERGRKREGESANIRIDISLSVLSS